MQVSKVSFNPYFTSNKKASKLKTGAAALIILAVPVSAQTQQDVFTQQPQHKNVAIPECFKYGVTTNRNKSTSETFSEIDSMGFKNGFLTKYEVVDAERAYWKNNYRKEMSNVRERYTEDLFDRLSKQYNHENSSTESIDYEEFLDIMQAYKKSKDDTTFDQPPF